MRGASVSIWDNAHFAAIGDLVRTGPTLTNVNDIRAILVS
jgi:glycerate-2-kinase